jgi:hypothetical protein
MILGVLSVVDTTAVSSKMVEKGSDHLTCLKFRCKTAPCVLIAQAQLDTHVNCPEPHKMHVNAWRIPGKLAAKQQSAAATQHTCDR